MYEYSKSDTNEYLLLFDGQEMARGSEQQLWKFLHTCQSQSVDWALKYGGYRIVPR